MLTKNCFIFFLLLYKLSYSFNFYIRHIYYGNNIYTILLKSLIVKYYSLAKIKMLNIIQML